MDDSGAVYQAYMNFQDLVRGGQVTPSWILAGPSFWYAEGGPQDRVIWRVDPDTNSKEALFDLERLRAALTEALHEEPAGHGVPFAQLEFVGERLVKFALADADWTIDLDSYEVARLPAPSKFPPAGGRFLVGEAERVAPQTFFRQKFIAGQGQVPERPSPDGHWFASVRDHNVALRATVDGHTVTLTDDGTAQMYWDLETVRSEPWSPDSQRLAVFKTDVTGMATRATIHWLKPLEVADETWALQAGGIINRDELYILDVYGTGPLRVDLGDTTDHYLNLLGWLPDGSGLLVARYDRLFRRVEILAADPATGATRLVLAEESKTFLSSQLFLFRDNYTGFWLLPDGSGFIWRSERDGWSHLYRYDLRGTLLARLTSGEFPVINVTRIDQKGGWVYFQAHGDATRVYDNHLYRVSLDGGEVEQLTEGKGRHTITMSPSCEAFLDTFSSVDTPPQTVLRRADGTMLQVLAEADISRLKEVGWVPSKEYVVKAADGETDLWVTIHFPYNFDPEKKYPVFEDIYAGPQVNKRVMDFGTTRPPNWEMTNFPRALAQLGFLVLTMDGRGTPGRSKAFHDEIYHNWGQFEIADHAGAITQLAARLPFIDLDRVAVSGASWGGHYTFRAMAQAPEVYRFGIPVVPEYDSRAHTLYEPFLGCLPADCKEVYDAADALALAPKLKGTMLQITGSNDVSTLGQFFRMSEALIRLGIHHDNMVYPNAGHGWFGATARYDAELKRRWLVEHMQS